MGKQEQISPTKYTRAKKCSCCDSQNTEMKPIGLQYYHPTKGVPYPEPKRNIHLFKDACLNAPDVHLLCDDCGMSRQLTQMEVARILQYEDNL